MRLLLTAVLCAIALYTGHQVKIGRICQCYSGNRPT